MIRWHLLTNCTTSLLCGTTTYTQQLRSTNSSMLQTMHWRNCLCTPGSSMTMTPQKLASLVALLGSWQSSLQCSWMDQRLWIWGGPRCFWGEQQFLGIGQQGTHGNIFFSILDIILTIVLQPPAHIHIVCWQGNLSKTKYIAKHICKGSDRLTIHKYIQSRLSQSPHIISFIKAVLSTMREAHTTKSVLNCQPMVPGWKQCHLLCLTWLGPHQGACISREGQG